MRNSIYIPLNFIICLLVVSSCKKEAQKPSFTDMPVVGAYLEVGSHPTVNISRLISFDQNAQYSTDDINALDISITTNNVTHQLQALGNGAYRDSTLIVAEGSTYNLQFNYNNQVVTSGTTAPSKPQSFVESVNSIGLAQIGGTTTGNSGTGSPPSPIVLTWTNPAHDYYLVVVENIEANPILINLNETTAPSTSFRAEPTQDATTQIRFRQFHYFGHHRVILHHILPEYADLYKNAGANSQNLTSPATNIKNGLGIFTAINSDTLYFNVIKL